MNRCVAMSSIDVRLGEEVEHRLVAPSDHRGERVDQLDEGLPALDHALVMERHVELGVLVAHSRRGSPRSPRGRSTRRRSTGRIPVRSMSDRKNTPPDSPMRKPLWPRVWPGRWTASTRIPPPRSNTCPSVKPSCVGSRRVVELLDHHRLELTTARAGQPVHLHQPVDAAGHRRGRPSWMCTRASANRPLPAM